MRFCDQISAWLQVSDFWFLISGVITETMVTRSKLNIGPSHPHCSCSPGEFFRFLFRSIRSVWSVIYSRIRDGIFLTCSSPGFLHECFFLGGGSLFFTEAGDGSRRVKPTEIHRAISPPAQLHITTRLDMNQTADASSHILALTGSTERLTTTHQIPDSRNSPPSW